jgi:hypothetical protein
MVVRVDEAGRREPATAVGPPHVAVECAVELGHRSRADHDDPPVADHDVTVGVLGKAARWRPSTRPETITVATAQLPR